MFDSAQLFNAMVGTALRGTPMGALMNGLTAAGVGASDGMALLSGLRTAIPAVAPAMAAAVSGGSSLSDDDKALLLAKAMISAAKADGEIDPDEQLNILNSLAEAGVSASARAWVEEEMKRPLDLDSLVDEARATDLAGDVFTASLMAIKVDTAAESSYLKELAARLGLQQAA